MTPATPQLPVYLLAGGRSRRFRSDKARAPVDGRPMICRVAEAVGAVATSVTVVAAEAGAYADLGLRTIADRRPGLGPLAGLETALEEASASGQEWLLLLACDFVRFDPAWAQALAHHATPPRQAVVFRGSHVEPMPGLYHASALPAVREMLEGSGRSLQRLLERLETFHVPLPANWPALAHVNTPQELQQALDEEAAGSDAVVP